MSAWLPIVLNVGVTANLAGDVERTTLVSQCVQPVGVCGSTSDSTRLRSTVD